MKKHLETLFLAHGQELQAYLTRQLRDPHTAADLMQETFVRYAGVRYAAGADGAGAIVNPRAFLYRIAGNLAIDRMRQDRARGGRRAEAELPLDIAAPEPAADEVVAGRQQLEILSRAIEELPRKCRDVFLLYRLQGLSMRAIAAQLGISEKTVEKHIAKAMVHCRKRLRAAGRNL